MIESQTNIASVADFIARWEASGAAERANYQLFLCELCDVIGVPRPEPAKADSSQNSYVFEHPVVFDDGLGHSTTKFIDLYKKGFFVLEAKQGNDKDAQADPSGLKMPKRSRRGTAVRGTQGWDEAMLAARGQAELYAKALPVADGWPPFLAVVDVGHSIEVYADFSRSGKTYVAFPDALNHRVPLKDLASEEVRERFRLVWSDPDELDPSRRSAKVTRAVAERLADLAKSLEKSGHPPEAVAHFLMRCLFTMFAEDVGLLPKDSFTRLLEGRRGKLDTFPGMLRSLWTAMDRGEFSPILEMKLLRFNGQLFADSEALPVTAAQLELLIEASKSDWRAVEPAIFGTLLERALDPVERHKLGAHYTPRAYVERLVLPTIVEPLREEWEAVQAAAVTLAKADKLTEAQEEVAAFLNRLCNVIVLDPACGTGNFLYVTLEHLKRLEGEARDALRGFGQTQEVFEGVGLTVDPHQLLGIEINPRAAAIAELVLWIGYLQWHFRTFGARQPAEPIIKAFHNIECRDALIDYDKTEPVTDAHGQIVTRWDGHSMKKHPVTGAEVRDENARAPEYRYVNTRKSTWPKANFVIGNPPFLGQQRMRTRLGDGYVDAVRHAHKDVPSTSDFVMYWWHIAADAARKGSIQRFGFVTTNKITQPLNRKVVEPYMHGENALSIFFAIPDHPWPDDPESADVRIAMSVAEKSASHGTLMSVVAELPTEDGLPAVTFVTETGYINPDLSIGVDLRPCVQLKANEALAIKGFELGSQGFLVTRAEGDDWLKATPGHAKILRPYMNGDDLKDGKWHRYAIDFFGFSESEAMAYHNAYQHVYDRVVADRATNREQRVIRDWWLFRRSGAKLRTALHGLPQFIGTTRTAKYRVFQFLPANFMAESKIVVIASDAAWLLGLLSSRIHVAFATRIGGWLGVGNDPTYNHTDCFNKFPFPELTPQQSAKISRLAEDLDAHRKRQLAAHPDLTITDLYNGLQKLRSGEALSPEDKIIHEHGLVSLLKQIHDRLDEVVFDAYCWPIGLSDEDILERLVALNAERAGDEERGVIRWLRPEFQNPADRQAPTQATLSITEPESEETAPAPAKTKAPWPKSLAEQAQAVRTALAVQRGPVTPAQLAKQFLRARLDRIEELLDTLVSLGQARTLPDGRFIAGIIGPARKSPAKSA
jgi:hypothetical protein